MKIAIGCDHAGPELKAEILAHLDEKGVEYLSLIHISEPTRH
mgnify:CR=1 FL=1